MLRNSCWEGSSRLGDSLLLDGEGAASFGVSGAVSFARFLESLLAGSCGSSRGFSRTPLW